jgi:phosphoglycolate phosphatase
LELPHIIHNSVHFWGAKLRDTVKSNNAASSVLQWARETVNQFYTRSMLTMLYSPRYRAVIFDLDGTLTDPAEGITRCIAYALERMHAAVPAETALLDWIGPPLREHFTSYLGGDAAAGEQALACYRERFATVGLFENRVYAGIPALLADLHGHGCRVLLATGKPQPYARRILEHFGLLPYFDIVGGATLDGTLTDKADILAGLLPRLTAAERAACVMVGDRSHDIEGARAHALPCIAVGYGFGSPEELRACAPAQIVGSVEELRAALCSVPPHRS